MLVPLIWFSALSFLGYGILCLTTPYMVAEFERYGMPDARVITGVLQILASAGLLLGLIVPKLGVLAAVSLALQMLVALFVRIRIEDTLIQSLPATFYLALNAAIAYLLLARR